MRKVRDSGGAARGLLALLLVAVSIIETQCKNHTEPLVTHHRRIISRRDAPCNGSDYLLGTQCCKKCKSGSVKNVSCPTDINKHCVPCEKGKEYIDHDNDLDECLRCKFCDSKFGWEVAQNCTPENNTRCTCAKNYYCSSVTCDHCHQCTICESGVIEKQCTPSSDTVCGTKETTTLVVVTVVVLVPLLAIAITGVICWRKRRRKDLTINGHPSVYKPEPFEHVPLIDIDTDLSSHIPAIVAEMTLAEVKKFVRHHRLSEPVIDQNIQDCPGDSSEQKIRLLRVWYMSHGMKGAYGTLISSLRELKMCAVADKIEEKLKAAISSSQDTGQSKTCTQEGRNSYNDSAELSKAYSGSLEET
ncbi:tumor necrosis factor receptor superfamily member 6 [Catharus ustulatus]|uniref:tumor necrosis factor receptor superfamily member 6 n=1 Tax=Catharus ustulatus TaxID=91951 RepID=UPI00140C4E33|nr:tumor necrosis factor receptor superfamily member 6 [Catharus ustulatus]